VTAHPSPAPGGKRPADITSAIHHARQRLITTSETPALDAQVLLSHLLDKPRAWLLAHPEEMLTDAQAESLEISLQRLESGEPLPYLLGHWEFYALDFTVTPAVLIPRPETELLVDTALAWLKTHPGSRRAVDIGTGSGCIAVSLARHAPELTVIAADISWQALRVVRQNALRHQVLDRMRLVQMDLLSALAAQEAPLDLLCANLPYIPSPTLVKLPVSRWEPRTALDGGEDGLDFVRRLLEQAPARLKPGGLALLEIEAGQGAPAAALARGAFPQARIQVLPDLAGLPRLLTIEA
jgi:release factor glutamine methyltransferase